MIRYKKCNCDDDCWEEIIVSKDLHYEYRTVMYFHCSECSEDFRVEDFITNEEVFYKDCESDEF